VIRPGANHLSGRRVGGLIIVDAGEVDSGAVLTTVAVGKFLLCTELSHYRSRRGGLTQRMRRPNSGWILGRTPPRQSEFGKSGRPAGACPGTAWCWRRRYAFRVSASDLNDSARPNPSRATTQLTPLYRRAVVSIMFLSDSSNRICGTAYLTGSPVSPRALS
jgi:hypothetical protein